MPLTPEQINQYRQKYNIHPDQPTEGTPPMPASERIKALKTGTYATTGLLPEKPDNTFPNLTSSLPSFSSRVKEDIQKRGQAMGGAIAGTAPESIGENSVVRGFQAAKEGAGAVTDVAGEAIKSLFSALNINADLPKPIKKFVSNVKTGSEVVKEDLNKAGHKTPGQMLQEWAQKNPEHAKKLESVLKVASASGEIAGTILLADQAAKLGNKVPILGSDIQDVPRDVKALATKTADKVIGAIDTAKGSPEFIKSTLDNHLATAKMQFEQMSPEQIKKAGGIDKVFEKNKEDIIMQLQDKGLDQQASRLKKLDIAGMKNPDEYEAAVRDIVRSSNDVQGINTNIEAVNPDLSGKKLSNAYKQVVTGNRETTSTSVFKEQGLTPDKQTINLGKRLADDVTLKDGETVTSVKLGKNPIKNLNSLGEGLDKTETSINRLLDGDPEINYNLDKSTLIDKLNSAKTKMPREFSAIKDSKTAFNNVMDFAQEKIANADDTIKGGRLARTEFDFQAVKEYPNAFKEGVVNTSTPAGRAIKTARDIINEHIYDTAPNGSDIKTLIGREADIFRATEYIAPKAAKLHGANFFVKFANQNPKMARVLKYGLITLGGDLVLKRTTGLGL